MARSRLITPGCSDIRPCCGRWKFNHCNFFINYLAAWPQPHILFPNDGENAIENMTEQKTLFSGMRPVPRPATTCLSSIYWHINTLDMRLNSAANVWRTMHVKCVTIELKLSESSWLNRVSTVVRRSRQFGLHWSVLELRWLAKTSNPTTTSPRCTANGPEMLQS